MVLRPIGALDVEVGAQKIMQALRRVQHVRVRVATREEGHAVLARPRQGGQLFVEGGLLDRVWLVGAVERNGRGLIERKAHHDQRAEHIRPDQRAVG